MAGNKPQFLQSVPETDEEKDIMSVLGDSPEESSNENTDSKEQEKPSTDGDVDSNSDTGSDDGDSKSTTSDDSKPGNTDDSDGSSDDADSDTPDTDGKDKSVDKKEDETSPIDLKFGNFKSAEEAEKAYKEMQRTLTKLTQKPKTEAEAKEQQKAAEKYIQLAKTTPLIDVKIPKSEDYRLDNGNFDMDGFSRDLVRNTVMAVQQGLIGGQLGSLQFGMMSEALGEEWNSSQQQVTKIQSARAIENKIYESFPIVKSNEKIAKLYERAILGEFHRRKNADGENAQALSEKDYLDIAQELVENLNITSTPNEKDAADKPVGQATLQPDGNRSKLTGVDKDIEDMMSSKSKTGSIF